MVVELATRLGVDLIRAATIADLRQIESLLRSGCEEIIEKHDTYDATEMILSAVSQAIVDGQRLHVAVEGDQIIGVCAWLPQPGLEGVVAGLGTYVHSAFRRRGISEELREKAEEWWRLAGYKCVIGTASSTNTAGLESVMKRGFRVVGLEVRKEL